MKTREMFLVRKKKIEKIIMFRRSVHVKWFFIFIFTIIYFQWRWSCLSHFPGIALFSVFCFSIPFLLLLLCVPVCTWTWMMIKCALAHFYPLQLPLSQYTLVYVVNKQAVLGNVIVLICFCLHEKCVYCKNRGTSQNGNMLLLLFYNV
jgi:hypothetical protein